MVLVHIKRDPLHNVLGFSCEGHADYAEKGADIICAAISTLTMSTILSLQQLTKLTLKIKKNSDKGWLECNWDNIPTEKEHANLIVAVMIIGLKDIAAQYPAYLKVSEVEV
ncbi:MAG TPA: hypothetical protein DDW50_12955 [Firmicutes bacterium]|nr:hypothetical protein [Bacillota bacterium]